MLRLSVRLLAARCPGGAGHVGSSWAGTGATIAAASTTGSSRGGYASVPLASPRRAGGNVGGVDDSPPPFGSIHGVRCTLTCFAATAMRSIAKHCEAGDIHSHSAECARWGWLRRRMVVGGSRSAVPPGAVTVTVTVLGAVVLPIRLSIGRLTSRCEPPLPPPPPSA